jgi:glycosyltransferase involved in cell wall biosynthesis
MTDRLVVLLTNIWLAHRAGSETVVRDVALGLLRRGHRPIVYSPALGAPAEEIAACGVCVIDDLRQLAETPDIIHAHHAIPCGEALIRFPQTPAIYVCHAFSPWMEAPVHFPQIGAYVAVDEACRDRLVHAEGIAPDRVTILRNAVDLRRVPPRLQPPRARPQRVLAFGKAAVMAEPRIACERLGLEYHALGDVGRTVAHPEHELVDFDLVFASARAALEAMCCGCAVIACDSRGSAGLVTPKNFDLLRAQNFGLRCLHEAATVDHCMEEIGRYDAEEVAVVTRRAREQADLEKTLDRFEALYAEVLAGPRRPEIAAHAHERAVAQFLHAYLPRRPGDSRWPWMAEKERLESEIQELRERVERETRAHAQVGRELESRLAAAQAQLASAAGERERLGVALADVSRQLADVKRSRLLRWGRSLRRLAGLPVPY